MSRCSHCGSEEHATSNCSDSPTIEAEMLSLANNIEHMYWRKTIHAVQPDFTGDELRMLQNALRVAAAPCFQTRVDPWLLDCFGEKIARNVSERAHRFLEEALELVQATGCSAQEAHQIVNYVFGRDKGKTLQEVGGVMVTLAALCLATNINMHTAAEIELSRVWKRIDVIRAKHFAKSKFSPLPGPDPSKGD